MRFVLSFLLCVVFLQSQLFALSGGPIYSTATSVVGTYSGVMVPGQNPAAPLGGGGGITNALALFTLGVPDTGLASGTFLIFALGRIFTGTITAFADPEEETMQGLLESSFSFTYSEKVANDIVLDPGPPAVTGTQFVILTQEIVVTGDGNFNVDVKLIKNRSFSGGFVTRLQGTAAIDFVSNNALIFPTVSLSFVVSGIRQSTAAPDAALTGA